jgi:hypothetical protein
MYGNVKARLEVTSARVQRQIIPAWLPAFVYLKRAGTSLLIGSLHVEVARIDLGAMFSAVFGREACG